MIAMVDTGRAFKANHSDHFMLVSIEDRGDPSGYSFPDEMHLMMFDNNMEDWRVWCQPSKLAPEKRNWFAQRVGAGSEKVHKAKLYI